MGKTKITNKKIAEQADKTPKEGEARPNDAVGQVKSAPKTPKKKVISGIINIDATFNNTKVLFADKLGNALFWSSSGSLGFRGAKKGTPFAASKVGDLIGSKVEALGVKDADVVVRGVGS